jgi:hypothetical protein
LSFNPLALCASGAEAAVGHGQSQGTFEVNARYFRNVVDISFIVGALISLPVAFLNIGLHRYGANLDNYSMLRSWQEMVANGIYLPSRFQGNVPSELLLGYLAAAWGPVGANSLSFACSISSLVLTYIIFHKVEANSIKVGLALATIAVNPYWVMASTTSMDYIHPIPLFIGGLLLLQSRLPILAAIFFAVASGMRLSYAPLSLGALLCALYAEAGSQEQKLICQSILVFLFTTCLIYLPVFVSSHLQLTFLASARPLWQGWPGLLGRWAYKAIYLYGFLGTLVLVVVLGILVAERVKTRGGIVGYKMAFYKSSVALIVFHLVLFLYIPVRIEYLLPVLIALSGVLLVRSAPNYLFIALIIAEGFYWFVNVDVLEVRHASKDPCAPVQAVGAQFHPHMSQGVLVGELTGRTNELMCLPQGLLSRPADIRDRLPVPAPKL